ncbi:MAG: hypothetical protein A3J76_01315 [Candidatus Moranbacteria bacterium RBG_13_45_13]|nr:MAG: hypothetical protein A3J76_01315 [Candidatus Moranbacteria bacterium RBG_13_45_13]
MGLETKHVFDSQREQESEKKHISVDVFRHSGPPFYQLNEWLVRSRCPEAAPDAYEQWFDSDLPPEGKELARKKAEEYFDKLNPKTDALFFVSSDLVRAAETAAIFLDVARKREFEIIKPRDDENREFKNHAEQIGEGWIRKIECLTLSHLENMLREFVFAKKDYLEEGIVDQNAVSEETKEMWARARKIMEEGGIEDTWGKNYMKFAERFEKEGIFPDVLSAEQVYKSKFFDMARMVKIAEKIIRKQNPQKNIRVLAFSHENSFLHFLNENFGEHMHFCENIRFEPAGSAPDDEILITAKGKTKKVRISRDFNKQGGVSSSKDEAREKYKKIIRKRKIEVSE